MNPSPGPMHGPFPSITELGRALREGRTTCLAMLEGCLGRIDRFDQRIQAWVIVDHEAARAQARRLDGELTDGHDRGPLHGVPIGIKDIIDVAGLPTACGSRRWADCRAASDADVVARLRRAGAVVMGKTVTTAYAWIDPPRTRNPWNLEHTPGGSSSGSAAAVAAGMCAGAIGSQTGGSIIRPASFCGVAGFKPSRAAVSTEGVFPFATSLDHVGPIARSVADLAILFRAIRMRPEVTRFEPRPPRLGRPRGFFDRRLHPSAQAATDHAVAALTAAGADVEDLDDPLDFDAVLVDHRRVMAHEAAALHSNWLDAFPEDYPPRIRDLILEGRSITAADYEHARAAMAQAAASLHAVLERRGLDGYVTPAATGPAPDPSTTGDPAFQSPFSFTGLPCASLPVGLVAQGLPVALQLVGALDRDVEILEHAQWCERAIHDAGLWQDPRPASMLHERIDEDRP